MAYTCWGLINRMDVNYIYTWKVIRTRDLPGTLRISSEKERIRNSANTILYLISEGASSLDSNANHYVIKSYIFSIRRETISPYRETLLRTQDSFHTVTNSRCDVPSKTFQEDLTDVGTCTKNNRLKLHTTVVVQ
jgi:hypothetical protein